MEDHVIREVVKRLWLPQFSRSPFPQQNGTHEISDSGLYVYSTGTDYDEDSNSTIHVLNTCCISHHRLQGLIRYMLEAHLAASEEDALSALIAHIKASPKPLKNRRVPLFLILAAILTVLIANMILAAGRSGIHDGFLPAYLHAVLLALPLISLVFLLLWGHEQTITRFCRELPHDNADEYFRGLCDLSRLLDSIRANRFAGINKPFFLALLAWLAAAVCHFFV